MSAARQFTGLPSSGGPVASRETPAAPIAAGPDNPLQLLRDAITQLKSSTGALPDGEEVATLLAEAREALERANIVAHAVSKCDAHLAEDRFDQALAALEEGLRTYPADPILVGRRQDVEERQRAFQSAAEARGAIQEAKWLLDHDRADLAAQFLKEKAAQLPDQQELKARLAELQALLPQWEEKRQVRDALARALSLEQLRQWQAALTVIDEVLEIYPSSAELRSAAERVAAQLAEDERRKKLERRIELIGQQIMAGSWQQALVLLEDTQLEFPGASELEPLSREISVGLRQSEREGALIQVRKCLADGDLELAERAFQSARSALGADPALEALGAELDAEKHYRGQLRQAQVLFGRGQFEDAERILNQPLDRDRPESQALLAAVRAARAASEEENLLEEGREKAHRLVGQKDFGQAAALLRNLLSLFPGNPILERDLAAAQASLQQHGSAISEPEAIFTAISTALQTVSNAPAPTSSAPEAIFTAISAALHSNAPEIVSTPPGTGSVAPEALSGACEAKFSEVGLPADRKPRAYFAEPSALAQPKSAPPRARRRFRFAALACVTSVVLASAAGIAWKQSQSSVPAPKRAAAHPNGFTATPAPKIAQTPPPTVSKPSGPKTRPFPSAGGAESIAPAESGRRTPALSEASSVPQPRAFVPPIAHPSEASVPAGALPVPPGTSPAISITAIPASPALLSAQPNVVAPPPPSVAPPKAPARVGGGAEEAQLLTKVLPVYPGQARESRFSGEVRLTAQIDEHGNVKSVDTVAGNPLLVAAAKKAVMQWKYKPATLNGKPVPASAQIRIDFVESLDK